MRANFNVFGSLSVRSHERLMIVESFWNPQIKNPNDATVDCIFNAKETDISADLFQDKYSHFTSGFFLWTLKISFNVPFPFFIKF